MKVSPNLIGLGAGLVSAVLFASLANSSAIALILFYLTPLPILLAGIGWGVNAALLSLLTSSVLLALLVSVQNAFIFLIFVGAPGVILSYLMLMHRQYVLTTRDGEDGEERQQTVIEWYPFGRIIAWAAIMVGVQVSAGIFLIGGGDSEAYRNAIASLFNEEAVEQFRQVLGEDFGPEQIKTLATNFALYILPRFAAALWLVVMVANLWLAAKSAAISGLLIRPLPVMSALEYPTFLAAGFAAALVCSMSSGMLGLIGTAFIGSIGLAFLLLGLIVIHGLLTNSAFKAPALIAVYFGLFFTPWVAPPIIGIGLAEPFLHLRARKANRNNQQNPPTDRSGPDYKE